MRLGLNGCRNGANVCPWLSEAEEGRLGCGSGASDFLDTGRDRPRCRVVPDGGACRPRPDFARKSRSAIPSFPAKNEVGPEPGKLGRPGRWQVLGAAAWDIQALGGGRREGVGCWGSGRAEEGLSVFGDRCSGSETCVIRAIRGRGGVALSCKVAARHHLPRKSVRLCKHWTTLSRMAENRRFSSWELENTGRLWTKRARIGKPVRRKWRNPYESEPDG
jgi:hypothetical protein